MSGDAVIPGFGSILQDFFCRYLINQKNVSSQSVAAYRDTFRLLLTYAQKRLGKNPAAMVLTDLDARLILDFLQHLEQERGNGIRTRNARLAAIRSFMKYAALRLPASLPGIQSILAIPQKRFERPVVGFLSREEMAALLIAPKALTWSGQRDQVMLATFYNTGARVSEIITLKNSDVILDRTFSVTLHGKGRKERVIPLWKSTAMKIRDWQERIAAAPAAPLFPNRHGRRMTRSGVEHRLKKAVQTASKICPRLVGRKVTPHILRHTTAMHLLQSGVEPAVIALWLGHESLTTTHIYMEADLAMKEQALSKTQEPALASLRYRPADELLRFLESL